MGDGAAAGKQRCGADCWEDVQVVGLSWVHLHSPQGEEGMMCLAWGFGGM